MNDSVPRLLDLAQGPLFRGAAALLILGSLRSVGLAVYDALATYYTSERFGEKFKLHLQWMLTPSLVLCRAYPEEGRRLMPFHLLLCLLSMVTRIGVIVLPLFMIAHLQRLETNLGFRWWAWPSAVVDWLALVTIITGALLFVLRFYSPLLRRVDPAWAFAKPLILVLPFLTGYLAMRPTLTPLSHDFLLLVHVASALVLIVMIPFGRILACLHPPVRDVLPQAAWRTPGSKATVV